MLDTPPERTFDAITELMKDIFKTPASHMVLIDPSRCWFKSWQGCWSDFEQDDGKGPYVECPRDMGWCNYICVPTTAEILIIEDAQQDARVSLNVFVVGPPYFRFYAGAPLVGAGGQRYGTLCVVDFVPRTFSADKYALLVNFAALAVEALERRQPPQEALAEALLNDVQRSRHLDLSLGASRDGVLMLDLRDSEWPILYANPAFESMSGLAEGALVRGKFWELFHQKTKTRVELGLFTGIGDSFEMSVCCRVTNRFFKLRFLPATSDRLAPSKATGLPAWCPFEGAGGWIETRSRRKTKDIVDPVKCFYFAMVFGVDMPASASMSTWAGENTGSATSVSMTSDAGSSADALSDHTFTSSGFSTPYGEYMLPVELGRMTMGPLLGSGSFGKVYRAVGEDGAPVAVKVMDCRRHHDEDIQAQLREVQLNAYLDHPNIARAFACATSTDMTEGRSIDVLWMVQELCDLGTLTNASELGWLRQERKLTSPADLRVLLPTLQDIASGMECVHERGIVHADLTGRNVLLASSDGRDHGFVAKVSDFGMSRFTYRHGLATKTLGTITHVPPELLQLQAPVLVPESDVWAFGVIAWEAYHGKRAYHGKAAPQIVMAVLRKKALEWGSASPSDFVSLMQRCLEYEFCQRPAFSTVAQELALVATRTPVDATEGDALDS